MVADESANAFRAIRAEGFVGDPPPLQIDSAVGARVRAGHHVALDDPAALRRAGCDEIEFWRVQGVHYLIPCVSAQTGIAVLALGRKERGEPLSSEDMALLVAVAAQVATAIENGRLYQQHKAQADQVERNAPVKREHPRVARQRPRGGRRRAPGDPVEPRARAPERHSAPGCGRARPG